MWILVANSSSARIYQAERRGLKIHDLKLVREFDHTAGRVHTRELYADRPGRVNDSNRPGRHALSANVEPRDQEVGKFARELAEFLHHERSLGAFYRLSVIAPPFLIGTLRSVFSGNVLKAIDCEIAKDFGNYLTPAELEKRIMKALTPAESPPAFPSARAWLATNPVRRKFSGPSRP